MWRRPWRRSSADAGLHVWGYLRASIERMFLAGGPTVHAGSVEHRAAVLGRTKTDGGTRLVTLLDREYPANLRRIYNRPPFLFVRGTLAPGDARSVAIVGTRRPSPAGLQAARRFASQLAEQGVTVVSGLAAGIDTEAHAASLGAGGRTIAVMGTGIDYVYPAENRGLASEIVDAGALVSQFWPGAPPRAQNFRLRNVVTSGMALGTLVVEAGERSGARIQARLALEHGKRLFLLDALVRREEWARRYARRPGAAVVRSIEDLLSALERADPVASAMTLF
ncbi:MAG: DNA-protecting protein DprA [Acidimicrobiia bacterium]|nr:DNA-protecting protein DprA [Acidimicrobiia bacterium]